jgi:hypothetical protein
MSLSIKYRPKTQILDFGTTKLRIIPERHRVQRKPGLAVNKGIGWDFGQNPRTYGKYPGQQDKC